MAGVPGTAAEIRMDYSQTAGATTGLVLPTGRPRDSLFIPEFGRSIEISIVDIAKATCFFHAAEAGIAGTEVPDRSEEHTSELPSLMRLSYAAFCLKKTNHTRIYTSNSSK